jgi:hypothetical protein
MPILARACHVSAGFPRPFFGRALADGPILSDNCHVCLTFYKDFENRRCGMIVAQSGPLRRPPARLEIRRN